MFGKADTAPVNLEDLEAGVGNGFYIEGAHAGDNAGFRISSAGDFNNDGLKDLLVGAPAALVNRGRVYVVYGKSDSTPVDLVDVEAGVGGITIFGEFINGFLGSAVSPLGDFNGDGFTDLALGASNGFYVIYGSLSPVSVDLTDIGTSDIGFRVGTTCCGGFGANLSSAGDFDGDGLSDLAVSEANSSTVRIFLGREANGRFDLDSPELDSTYTLVSGEQSSFFGSSLDNIGDVNDDGYSDLIVGASGVDVDGRMDAGAVYIVFGAPGARVIDTAELLQGTGLRVSGIDPIDQLGVSVSGGGDIDGDGLPDIVVGAPGGDLATDDQAGEAYILFGQTRFLPINDVFACLTFLLILFVGVRSASSRNWRV